MPSSLSLTISLWLTRYYFGPDHPLKLRLWDWFMRALGRPRLSVPYGPKGRLTLDISDMLQFEILKTGFYEPEVWEALASNALQNEVLWDVGANIGTVGILAAMDPRVKSVHLFEPNPKTFRVLDYHRTLNPHLALNTHPVALGVDNKEKDFFFGPDGNKGLSGFVDRFGLKSVKVPCFSGDAYIAAKKVPSPTLMKIDVEGWELEVLKGLTSMLKNHPPKAIVFEAFEDGTSAKMIVDFLAPFGFKSRKFSYKEPRDTTNYIAVLNH